MDKRIREITKLKDMGVLSVSRTRGGHLKILLDNGKYVFFSYSPSDKRSIRELKTKIRTAEINRI